MEPASIQSASSFEIAKEALPLMARHGVEPVPQNYSVWYFYVARHNPKLNEEIDAIIKKNGRFSDDINEYLYTRYVADDKNKIIQETTKNAEALLAEVMGAVKAFSGKTAEYRDEMSEHIGELSEDAQHMSQVLQNIIKKSTTIRDDSNVVSTQLETSQDEIQQLKAKLAEAQSESETDFLTGTYNRKYLDRRLDEIMDHCRSEDKELCMLLADIDHFKKFNDQFGHLIGDEVLKIVAKALMQAVKGQDVVARFGGEEFCILLPSTPVNGALTVAENIRKSIASKELKRRDTGENYGQITISIGVAMMRESDTIPTFIQRADAALYQSKNKGRNCVTMDTA